MYIYEDFSNFKTSRDWTIHNPKSVELRDDDLIYIDIDHISVIKILDDYEMTTLALLKQPIPWTFGLIHRVKRSYDQVALPHALITVTGQEEPIMVSEQTGRMLARLKK